VPDHADAGKVNAEFRDDVLRMPDQAQKTLKYQHQMRQHPAKWPIDSSVGINCDIFTQS
jgi:hypothetical protein